MRGYKSLANFYSRVLQKGLISRWRLEIARCFLAPIIISGFILTLTGCETVARKFSRQHKKAEVKEEFILVPEEYSSLSITKEERYRRHLLFWQSWQDELIIALGSSASYKKRNYCIQEAIRNLEEAKPFLFEEKQKELGRFLEKLYNLKQEINRDIYGNRLVINKSKAKGLRRDILRKFSYLEVKDYLK